MSAGVLPYEQIDGFVFREEASFDRELANFSEMEVSMSLGGPEEAGQQDRWSPKLNVPNGGCAGMLIMFLSKLVGRP